MLYFEKIYSQKFNLRQRLLLPHILSLIDTQIERWYDKSIIHFLCLDIWCTFIVQCLFILYAIFLLYQSSFSTQYICIKLKVLIIHFGDPINLITRICQKQIYVVEWSRQDLCFGFHLYACLPLMTCGTFSHKKP